MRLPIRNTASMTASMVLRLLVLNFLQWALMLVFDVAPGTATWGINQETVAFTHLNL